jgi:phosphoribosylanthranilate isomerase
MVNADVNQPEIYIFRRQLQQASNKTDCGSGMKRPIIQIYEVQTPREAEQMIALGVDHVGGVIESEAELRNPALKEMTAAVRAAGRKSSLIPLFTDRDAVSSALDYYHPDIVHFCEDLTRPGKSFSDVPALINLQAGIRETFPEIEIMRSIPIGAKGKIREFSAADYAAGFVGITDFFLTDTVLSKGAVPALSGDPESGFVGITGIPCDWDEAARLVRWSPAPVILAGGLAPENVKDAVTQVRAAGYDSCSGTNRVGVDGRPLRFQKDIHRVRRFVEAVETVCRALAEEGANNG